jgi:hypothetical protein
LHTKRLPAGISAHTLLLLFWQPPFAAKKDKIMFIKQVKAGKTAW